jgi:putative membrane protein
MFRIFKRGPGVPVMLGAMLFAASLATPAATADPGAFVQAATQAAMLEIEAGKVAMNASTNADVKTFADRMITDHGRSSSELAVIAKKKSLNVPTELDATHARALRALREKSAREFDAAYAGLIVEHHARAVALFEANAHNADSELAAYVELTLPVLKEHQVLTANLKASLKP